MIISHEHQYCFFAIPRTGSQALSKHLIQNYDGERMGPMHNSYHEFQASTANRYRDYLSFTIVRNPLDSVVSAYFKKKTDHNGRFSRGYFKNGKKIGQRSMDEFLFIQENNATFSEYFLHFFNEEFLRPRHTETVDAVEKVLRFEQLENDFKELCQTLRMKYQPIPVVNPTQSRSEEWSNYYQPEARALAKRTMAKLMEEWGYTFPEEW